jgi:hypothetical protein
VRQYTFFSTAHGTFFKTDHILGQQIQENQNNPLHHIVAGSCYLRYETLRQFSRKQCFIVPAQTQQTCVQRLSPETKGGRVFIVVFIHNGVYSATRNNDMGFEGKWMQLEDMLSEVSKDQKHKSHMFLSYMEDRFKDKHIHKDKHDHIQAQL